MGNELSQIDDGFFICGVEALVDTRRLKTLGITHVLNVARSDLYKSKFVPGEIPLGEKLKVRRDLAFIANRLAAPCCALLRLAAPCCALLRLAAPCCALLRLAAPCCASLLELSGAAEIDPLLGVDIHQTLIAFALFEGCAWLGLAN
jgi:hypothetical protein